MNDKFEKSMKTEIDTITNLIDSEQHEVKLDDTGGNSRAYIIDGGKIVFKFPRNPQVSYDNEISILQAIDNVHTDVVLQKVGWLPRDNEYIGLLGVAGESIRDKDLTRGQAKVVGKKVGSFLRRLHEIKVSNVSSLPITEEIRAWQERYLSYKDFINSQLDMTMQKELYQLMMVDMPKDLNALGEDLVFCHGDLGGNNIFVNNDSVGIIDFNESGYLDRAADFMDISDEEILSHILDSYGADETLRSKVGIRRKIRSVATLRFYMLKKDEPGAIKMIDQIRTNLS